MRGKDQRNAAFLAAWMTGVIAGNSRSFGRAGFKLMARPSRGAPLAKQSTELRALGSLDRVLNCGGPSIERGVDFIAYER